MGLHNKLPEVELACSHCGRLFVVNGSRVKEYAARKGSITRYCSAECSYAARKIEPPTFVCASCGKVTVYPKNRKSDGKLGSYNRKQKYCSRSCAVSAQPRKNSGWRDKAGYRVISRNGGQYAEHRLVMEAMLGRPLHKGENVHHKDGDRANNRPENLELWTVAQVPGQRVADKVAWAIDLIKQYPEFAREHGYEIVTTDEAAIIRSPVTPKQRQQPLLNKKTDIMPFDIGVP